jgi:hypothetical protein
MARSADDAPDPAGTGAGTVIQLSSGSWAARSSSSRSSDSAENRYPCASSMRGLARGRTIAASGREEALAGSRAASTAATRHCTWSAVRRRPRARTHRSSWVSSSRCTRPSTCGLRLGPRRPSPRRPPGALSPCGNSASSTSMICARTPSTASLASAWSRYSRPPCIDSSLRHDFVSSSRTPPGPIRTWSRFARRRPGQRRSWRTVHPSASQLPRAAPERRPHLAHHVRSWPRSPAPAAQQPHAPRPGAGARR